MGAPYRINTDLTVDGMVDVVGETTPEFWATNAWASPRMSTVKVTEDGVTLTHTTPADGAFGIQRGRAAYSAGAGGNDRRVVLYPEVRFNQRMRGTWYNHSVKSVASPGLQAGYALRVRQDPDGFWRGFIVRHDVTFGQDNIIQVGLWRWPNDASALVIDANDLGTFPGLPGLVRTLNVAAASRTGNVVTAVGITDPTTGFAASLVAGHTYTASFPGDATYNVTFVATDATHWPQVAADDAASGAGTITDLDGVWPLEVDAQTDGPSVYVKAWRSTTPEPSWADPNYNMVMRAAAVDPYPNNPGRKGYFIGHPGVGKFVEFGPTQRDR